MLVSKVTKYAAVEVGTEDFSNPDCWYFNDAKRALRHAAARLAETGTVCDVRPVPPQFVNARIAEMLAPRT